MFALPLAILCSLLTVGKSKHGSLHPTQETDCSKNYHKLEIFFDKDCVLSQQEAEVESLIYLMLYDFFLIYIRAYYVFDLM